MPNMFARLMQAGLVPVMRDLGSRNFFELFLPQAQSTQ
jgi:hypothetical protein